MGEQGCAQGWGMSPCLSSEVLQSSRESTHHMKHGTRDRSIRGLSAGGTLPREKAKARRQWSRAGRTGRHGRGRALGLDMKGSLSSRTKGIPSLYVCRLPHKAASEASFYHPCCCYCSGDRIVLRRPDQPQTHM